MLREERHRYILDRIKQNHRVYLTGLSEELAVSDDTIRRDLTELDQKGLLTKVHGGAISKSGIPLGFADRLKTDVGEKNQLAVKAGRLFKPGELVMIDGGSTNLAVARQIPQDLALTVVTNSFPVVEALTEHPNVDLVFLGGNVFKGSQVTVGVPVFQALQNFQADLLLLGVSNVHPQRGLTVPDREEALLKRQMIEQAKKVAILVESNKLNTAENYKVASLHEVEVMIVEDGQVQKIKRDWSEYSLTVY